MWQTSVMTKGKALAAYGIMGMGGSLICLLLIPAILLIVLIYCLWKLTDKLVKKLEAH